MCETCGNERVCVNCGKHCEPRRYVHKRCNACRSYLWRHGVDRDVTEKRKPPALVVCSNCGKTCESRRHSFGRCNQCYKYFVKHGAERPLNRTQRIYRKDVKQCRHCQVDITPDVRVRQGYCMSCYEFKRSNGRLPEPHEKRGAFKRGLCKRCKVNVARYLKTNLCVACHTYLYRHNKPRPRHKFAQQCSNCGVQKSDALRFVNGMCRTCYQYQWTHGEPRPAHKWKGTHGVCDCGKPANHIVKVTIHKHVEDMPLCDECHSIHMQHVRWYGDNTKNNARLPLSGDD